MIKPLFDRIYVIPLEDPDRTKAGLYVPEQGKQKCDQGIVKYCGPDVQHVKVSDHVFFSGYTGTRMAIEGEGVLYIMQECDVEAVYIESDHSETFTLAEIRRKLRNGVGDLIARELIASKESSFVLEVLSSLFEDKFRSEGLLF